MHDQSSYDENGPLTSIGDVTYTAKTGLPSGPQKFQLPTFLVAGDESKVVISYKDFELTDFGARNDHYGFGTSPETALADAKKTIESLQGCNVDIRIVTKLVQRPCFPSDDAPFYDGAQRVRYISRGWQSSHEFVQEQTREFVVWENGKPTQGAQQFYDIVAELCEKDAAPNRKGELRSILARKNPATRESFMAFADLME